MSETSLNDVELLNNALGNVDDATANVDTAEDDYTDSNDASDNNDGDPNVTKDGDGDDDDAPQDDPTASLRPTYSAIKDKYPTIFNEFPDLKTAFFAHKEYSKHFPTVDDAAIATQELDAFETLKESVLSGKTAVLYNAIKAQDPEALQTFAVNLLPELYKANPAAYERAVTPVVETMLRTAFAEGTVRTRRGDASGEQLQLAARILSEMLFDTEDVATGTKTAVRPLEAKKDNSVELFTTASTEVATRVESQVNSIIRTGLDPNNAMTPFMRKAIIAETVQELERKLTADSNFMAAQQARWVSAQRNKFDEASKRKIETAYLARAKALLPDIRKTVVARALNKANADSVDRGKKLTVVAPRNKEVTSGTNTRSSANNNIIDSSKRIDYSRTSDVDILLGKITYKD
jgi:hypothetical protein